MQPGRVWRLFELFRRHDIPVTVFAVAMALARNPAVAEAALAAGHEICSHGYRWFDYRNVPEDVERAHLHKAIEIITDLTGERPLGWYTGRTSANTRRLVVEEGGFYDADDYNDDLPDRGQRHAPSGHSLHSTPTICASPRRRGLIQATSFSAICATPSMFYMKKAR